MRLLKYLLPVLLLFSGIQVMSQNDGILKPVEIHPPHPATPPKEQKKESDEQLASQYYRNGDYDKAVVLYEKLFKEKKNQIYYHYYLYCLTKLEEFKKAEKLVKSQKKKYPGQMRYTVDLGFVYSQAGDGAKAKRQYDEAIKNISANINQIKDLANTFLMRGQPEYAIITYKRGQQLISDYPFNLELGNLYRQTGDYRAMIEQYLDYIDFNYSNVDIVEYRLQDVLDKDKEGKTAEMLRIALLKRIQKQPEKIYFSKMLYWLAVQEKNFGLALSQAKAIDKRTGSDGEIVLELAELCISNEEYDIAIDSYKYVLKKGKNNIYYLDARIGLLNARYQKITGSFDYTKDDLTDLEKDYILVLDDYGRNATTIQVMEFLGHLQAFYLDKTDEAIEILNYAIEIPNARPMNVAQCKIELADILLFVDNVWDAKLLYSQVEKQFKNEPIGHLAKFKNAKLSFYIGQFDWAKAQLDVLKAATSKFIANDALQLSVLISDNIDIDSSTVALSMYARADLLLFRNHDKEALEILDSIFELGVSHPIYDEVLYKKAEIMIKNGEFKNAANYLTDIVDNYSYDITADDALFLLAELNEKQLGDKDKAMEYYQLLLIDYPASVYTARARKHFRYLRGDFDSEGDTRDEEIMLENKL